MKRTKKEIAQKVKDLLGKMSIDEKVAQLLQMSGNPMMPGPKAEDVIRERGVGSILWLNETKRFNELQKIAIEEGPHGIPILFALDVIHGYRTIMPVPLAMAASWDPEIVVKGQKVAAREARAAGIHWTFAPMLDIARDPRWGRIVEGAGEDPYLGSAMAAAQVRGFQGDDPESLERVAACAKHFAGYGAADGGRDYDPVFLSDAQLKNVYLPPFHAAVKAGVDTFMSAYMDLNNVPASANKKLLRDVLRGDWNFEGFVVSDAMAPANLVIQGHAKDLKDAAERSFKAGLNMDMASGAYLDHLADLAKEGKISSEEIDAMVWPILELKVRMGLFENPYVAEDLLDKVVAMPEHRQVALEAAQRSMVLLRNEGGLLPLPKTISNVAVIGPLADSKEATEGSWLVFDHVPAAVTVFEGVKAKLPKAKVTYACGPTILRDHSSFFEDIGLLQKKVPQTAEESQAAFEAAVATAKQADLVIMVLGENAEMAGEYASRGSLDLSGRQEELLKAVSALGKPVVLVLISGRPLSINWAAENVPAILEAWEPGSEGGTAVADILFGDVNPGGKLPVTFPRAGSHSPLYYARTLTHQPENHPQYRSRYWDSLTTPLFPFGFGLSYTTFEYTNLKLSTTKAKIGESIMVSVDVTNNGSIAGDEVVQMYIHQKWGSDSRPMRELKGFQRINLKPGETKTIQFTLGNDELSYWSTNVGDWVLDKSEFDVWVGGDSNANLHAGFEIG